MTSRTLWLSTGFGSIGSVHGSPNTPRNTYEWENVTTDDTCIKRVSALERLNQDKVNDLKRVRRELGASEVEVRRLSAALERYATIKPQDMKVPAWLTPKKRSKKHHGTAVLMLSDLHLDEVVELDEMDGINSYSRAIAEKRLQRVVDGAVMMVRDYVAGLEIDGIVVALLGDIITGDIHEELAKTNEAPVPATIVHWVPILASALRHLADEFGKVHVPTVDGNHDRTTKRTQNKKRAETSNAWIVYNWLADTLRDDPRITFGISTSPEQIISVYDTRFLLSHGDTFRSAGGVGGLYPSLLKWLLRRHSLYSQTKQDFDFALLGHWHQYLLGQDFFVNGSLKGYDEYAKQNGFGFERPLQSMFIVTPERGVIQRMPIHAD